MLARREEREMPKEFKERLRKELEEFQPRIIHLEATPYGVNGQKKGYLPTEFGLLVADIADFLATQIHWSSPDHQADMIKELVRLPALVRRELEDELF